MRIALLLGAGSAALLLVGQSLAASPTAATAPATPATSPADNPGSPNPDSTANSGAAAQPSAAPARVVVGEPVKDNTGATIGQIASIAPDPSGQQLAVIKMGVDQFRIETTKLASANGAATINLSQAQILAQLHGSAAPQPQPQ